MKAYELQESFGIDAIQRVERPRPEPGPGQALVRVHATSLNYRDLMVVKGLYNPKMRLPRTPLSDAAGEVEATGAGVTRVRVGDRVAGIFMQGWLEGPLTELKAKSALGGALDGVLAEYVVLDEQGLVHIPPHLSYEEASTLPCAAVTAWNALMGVGLEPGETVLALGTGGVSIFALQFARLAGARVLITSSSDKKLERAGQLGASDGINYRSVPDWDKKVRDLTSGTGVDHVVEVGGAGTLPLSLRAVRVSGHIALIGVLSGNAGEVNPLPVLVKNIRLQGIFVGSRAMFDAMNGAITLHKLAPVLDRVFPFEQAREALRYMESGAHFGKIVIRV
jgi:NADPH:quinone reductase-like Zn-dependent oxidoreductase